MRPAFLVSIHGHPIKLNHSERGDFSSTIPFFSNPLDFFLGKDIFVDVEDLIVYGRIIRYQLGQKERPHRPFILILESPIGKVLIRGNWTVIKQDLKRALSKPMMMEHDIVKCKDIAELNLFIRRFLEERNLDTETRRKVYWRLFYTWKESFSHE
jgi:hypothetical protein